MRCFLPPVAWLVMLSAFCEAMPAKETAWYVAPAGDDAAAGTLQQPFATLQRAQDVAAPGDTVYLRGGVYRITEAHIAERKGIFARVIVLNKSGERGRPISYRPYQEETPVFDFSDVNPAGSRVSALYVSGSWLHLVGLEAQGVQVTMRGHTQSICVESQGSNNVFERLRLHDGQAIGVYHVRGSNNLFLNCDAWNNWDRTSEDGKGGNVDGFGCHPTRGSTGNVFRGCRAWFNSDDGYDCINAYEAVRFEQCWAAYNGLSSDGKRLADGNGFKAGGYGSTPAERLPKVIPRHVVRLCLAVGNKNSGFYANHHPGGCDWENNTAYRNGTNYNLQGRLADNRTEVAGYGHRLTNNLGYPAPHKVVCMDAAKCELVSNSFSLPDLEVTNKDFVSLDEKELAQPRQGDGHLPDIDLLRPAASSPLLTRGTPSADGMPATIGASNSGH
jgi:hypothetical protein